MWRLSRMAPLVAVVMLGAGWPGPTALAAGTVPTWGRAHPVPGLSKLNKYLSEVNSVSCGSVGNCAAVGRYTSPARAGEGFVISEKNGTWGQAQEVPGLGALNQGNAAEVDSVSCASAGNCAAVGSYDSITTELAFVVSEKDGVWGQAHNVPGLARLINGGQAAASVVSCDATGNCGAGGTYSTGSSEATQAFVVNETNGTWGQAEAVPGLAMLNSGGSAAITAISCPAAGACTGVGTYRDSSNHQQVFVADESGGTWGTAQEQPGLAALNVDGSAGTTTVSCNAAGSCGTGGYYSATPGNGRAYLASESGGTWHKAEEVPGIIALGSVGAGVSAVSCVAAGACSAGGSYVTKTSLYPVFVVSETNGIWGTAKKLPGQAGLTPGVLSDFSSISCWAVGDCGASGVYGGGFGVYAVSQNGGTWGKPEKVSGLSAIHGVPASLPTISCPAIGKCVGGGIYGFTDRRGGRAYLVSQS